MYVRRVYTAAAAAVENVQQYVLSDMVLALAQTTDRWLLPDRYDIILRT